MEALLSNPLYATLAFACIAVIVGWRFIGPIVDRIAAGAMAKQKAADAIDNTAKEIGKLREDFTKHEEACGQWKKDYGEK